MDTLLPHGPLDSGHEPIAERRVCHCQPAETMSAQSAAPAFLKHRFLPLVADHPILRRSRWVQGEFFRSVGNLVQLYRLSMPEPMPLPYPLNIHAAFVQLRQQLERAQPALSLVIVQTKEGVTTLATAKPVDLDGTLYYIPLLPMFRLLSRPRARYIAPILLGIAAFIRQKMCIPSYVERGSYIADVYNVLEQWVGDTESERDEQENAECYRDFQRAYCVGYRMHQKMRQPMRVSKLPSYLQAFLPADTWEFRLRQLGMDFIQLSLVFPDRCLFSEIPDRLLDEEVEDEDRIRKEQYLSFVYDHYSWLGEEMNDYIETSLQECAVIDAPVTVQCFHQPQEMETHDPAYETTCLRLLNEFAYLLNNIDYEQY